MKTTPRFWLATLFAMLPLTAFADWNEISSFDDGMRVFVNTGTVERIDEIARMLGGVNITDTTRRHAAEMLGLSAPA